MVLTVSGHRTDLPQLGEPLVARTQYADQLCQARVAREAAGGAAQVGHDGGVGGVPVQLGHGPCREASRACTCREPVAGEIAQLRWRR